MRPVHQAIRTRLITVCLAGLCLQLLAACDPLDQVGQPIEAGTDSPDEDVSGYLKKLLLSAQGSPESALLRGRLGMAYDVNGLSDAAIATYAQAEALNPDDFRWPYFRANLMALAGDPKQALVVLQQALAIDPDYGPAWLWQGTWLLDDARPDEAMDAFDRALALDAGPAADFGRAQVLVLRGEHEAAITILTPLAAASGHPYIYRTLGEALRAIGRSEEAKTALNLGKDALPIAWVDERREERDLYVRGYASYELAKSLSASGDVAGALAIITRLQKHHPEAHCAREADFFLACNLMNSTGIAYDRAGLPTRAQETIDRGVSLNPAFIPFRLTLTNLYRQQGDLDNALAQVDQAIRLNPARGYAHEQRGRLLFGLKQYEDASLAFAEALKYEPGKRTTLFYQGLAEVELGRWQSAADIFAQVVEVDSGFALGYVFLARALAETGQLKEAHKLNDEARARGADPGEIDVNLRRLRTLEAKR